MKLNSVEWWKAVGKACEKDEAYLRYLKECTNPMTLKLKVALSDDKPIMATFENGRMVDVHEAGPGEECKVGVVNCTLDLFTRIVKGEVGMVYACTHKMFGMEGMVSLMQFGRPFMQMFESVAKTVPCEEIAGKS